MALLRSNTAWEREMARPDASARERSRRGEEPASSPLRNDEDAAWQSCLFYGYINGIDGAASQVRVEVAHGLFGTPRSHVRVAVYQLVAAATSTRRGI